MSQSTFSELTVPQVVAQSVEGEHVHYDLYVQPNMCCFEGHFPGVPIVPGVVQIEWVVLLAAKVINLGEFKSMVRVKFNRPILPGVKLQLHLIISQKGPETNSTVQYRFFNDDGGVSSGRLIFV